MLLLDKPHALKVLCALLVALSALQRPGQRHVRQDAIASISCAIKKHRDTQRARVARGTIPDAVSPLTTAVYVAYASIQEYDDLCSALNHVGPEMAMFAVDMVGRQVSLQVAGSLAYEAPEHRSALFPSGTCQVHIGSGDADGIASIQYLVHTKHLVGQWAAARHINLSTLAGYRDGVGANYMHAMSSLNAPCC
jgi:hypothetical protein